MSAAVIVVTAIFIIIAGNVIKFSKSVKVFVDDIDKESSVIYQKINKFLESVFTLAFVSKFFGKKKSKIKE